MLKKVTVMLLAVFFAAGSSVFAAFVTQDVVDQVSQVSYSSYLNDMLYTHAGDDRGYGPEHDLARSNIHSELGTFGLTTGLHSFSYYTGTYYNVIATHYGTVRPNDIYVVGAHYDSVNNPGADDNASGTAGVLEAARVLSQYDFEATLVFACFDREEQGLIGSRAYANENSTSNILGMISLDMIAYNGSGANKARIYGRSASSVLKQELAGAVSLYGNGLSADILGTLNASDHAPFEDNGFPAALLIEYDVWNNPYYHQPGDSVDTLNYIDYAFATNMVSSTVGFLADAAVLVPEPTTLLLLGLGVMILRRRK